MARFDTPLQRKAGSARAGTLPEPLKSGIEALSGIAMDEVRVHANSAVPAQSGAIASTEGTAIHIGPGGEAALPHEAWHVVQQAQGRVRPTTRLDGGTVVNDDAGLEREADVMGARATRRSVAAAMVLRAMPPATPGGMVVQRMKWVDLDEQQKAIIRQYIADRWTALKNSYKKYKNADDLLAALMAGDADVDKALSVTEAKARMAADKETIETGSKLTQEKILTERLSGDTGSNVAAGPNGMFDLRYDRERGILTVTVRMALPPGVENEVDLRNAIQETQAFWNNGGNPMVMVGPGGERISIHVNIEIASETKEEEKKGDGSAVREPDFHFRYDPQIVDVPTTSREGRRLTAGPNQVGPTEQRTLFHEFGHALGLGEEYGDLSGRTHLNRAKEIMTPEAYNKSGIANEMPDTIMGFGNTLHPHHFVEILHSFCRLIGTTAKDWRIAPESEADLPPKPEHSVSEGDERRSTVTATSLSPSRRRMTGGGIAVGDELTGTREQLAARVGSPYLATRLVQARPGQIFTAGGYVWACTALTGQTNAQGVPELIYTIRRIPDGSHLL